MGRRDARTNFRDHGFHVARSIPPLDRRASDTVYATIGLTRVLPKHVAPSAFGRWGAHMSSVALHYLPPISNPPTDKLAFSIRPPRLARNARTYQIKLINGTTARRTSSDPGRALLTGYAGGLGFMRHPQSTVPLARAHPD